MSTFPEQMPRNPEDQQSDEPNEAPASDPLAPENTPIQPGEWTAEPEEPRTQSDAIHTLSPLASTEEQPHVASYTRPQPLASRDERIPHLGHLGLLFLLVLCGLVSVNILVSLA